MSSHILSTGFWKLPHCSKLDRLDERRHTEVILRALSDEDTQIEEVSRNTYNLTGPSEALLLEPQSSILQMVMILCGAIPATIQP